MGWREEQMLLNEVDRLQERERELIQQREKYKSLMQPDGWDRKHRQEVEDLKDRIEELLREAVGSFDREIELDEEALRYWQEVTLYRTLPLWKRLLYTFGLWRA